ncbi:amino acid adenylation domain-containing protein [Kitasatospora sp. NPDC051170]|uniref:amino acid adenylation domain-containing protein n=1 Tax=Kitasatospora sp. NPDC051170 TaxID=3364056 RepID=UPI00379CA226
MRATEYTEHTAQTAHTAHPKEEALWLLETLVPGSVPNNLSLAFRVAGRIDAAVLEQALAVLLRRHEVLRTVFRVDGARLTRNRLAPEQAHTAVERLDLPAGATAHDALTAFVARPFTLDGGPLLRAAVLSDEEADHVCVAVHHLVFDAASVPVFVDELAAAYTALAAGGPLPEELTRIRAALDDPEPTAESLAHWQGRMAGFDPDVPDLWCGSADTAEPTLRGEQLTRPLSPEAAEVVRTLQRKLRAPEAVVLLAAYVLLLDAHGAGPDVVVGFPANLRPSGAERAVGYHVNVLPLRVRTDPASTVRELVRAVRDTFFESLTHTDVPVDSLARSLPRATTTWRNMLFRHVFNYLPGFGVPEFELAGARATPLPIENGYSKFDLEFFVMSADGEIRIRTVYRTEILTRTDAELLLERYEALLLAFAADPEQPVGTLLAWGERDHAVIGAANRTEAPDTAPDVLRAIHRQVRDTPDAVAVVDGERTLTYRRLWDAAHAVRAQLTAAGVAAGDTVALALPRSAELAAAVLGTWLAGAAYLPVDPDHPAQRIDHQLTDSGTRVLLARPGAVHAPSAGLTVLHPAPATDAPAADRRAPEPADPDGHAYLIYTSGSTGRPKGTAVTHRGVANLVAHFIAELAAGPGHATLWTTTFAFDISALELYVPLASGGQVVAAPDEVRVDGGALLDLIDRHDVRTVQATPTTWRMVLDKAAAALAGRQVLCGGEPLPGTLAQQLLATGCELHHVYGPTETTVWSTSGTVPQHPGARIDIGRPIRNTRILVTDPAGRELPLGVRGELCIAGDGVAAGYHGRPELTADRFREHPRHGRHYRTGDLAHWRPDGTLALLGRSDRQVKLRGNRIELGEIEAVLLGAPDVGAVAVLVHGDSGADAELIAFVVPEADRTPTPDQLWDWARTRLARAMVPQEFVLLDALPTNANEKVDYPALARTAAERAEDARARRRAAAADRPAADTDDDLVTALVALYDDLLPDGGATPDTNFFTTGGNSLLGALLGQRVEEMTGVSLRLAEVFQHPTPAQLAARVRADEGTAPPVGAVVGVVGTAGTGGTVGTTEGRG